MPPQTTRNRVFHALKQVLKAKGLHYKDLAEQLQVSEPTIKRLFQEQDCKMSRLLEICQALQISLSDLMSLLEQAPAEPSSLEPSIEQSLAEQPLLFNAFMLLLSGFDAQAIAEHNPLSRAQVYLILRELEKLHLIKIGVHDSVSLLKALPIRWRFDGPLHRRLREVNQQFVGEVIERQQRQALPFYSCSRLLSPHSQQQLGLALDELYQRFQQQAVLDQMAYPREALVAHKLVCTMAPFEVARYFPLTEKSA